jgi:hypothetical protein
LAKIGPGMEGEVGKAGANGTFGRQIARKWRWKGVGRRAEGGLAGSALSRRPTPSAGTYSGGIEGATAAEHQETGKEPLGEEGVRAQDPETRPRKIKKSPAPFVHAATKAARKAMWEAYGWFVAAFREAADKLKVGDRSAAFPAGSFPPGLPFVAA